MPAGRKNKIDKIDRELCKVAGHDRSLRKAPQGASHKSVLDAHCDNSQAPYKRYSP